MRALTAVSISFETVGWMLLAWAGGSLFAAMCWACFAGHLKRRIAELEAFDRRREALIDSAVVDARRELDLVEDVVDVWSRR